MKGLNENGQSLNRIALGFMFLGFHIRLMRATYWGLCSLLSCLISAALPNQSWLKWECWKCLESSLESQYTFLHLWVWERENFRSYIFLLRVRSFLSWSKSMSSQRLCGFLVFSDDLKGVVFSDLVMNGDAFLFGLFFFF